MSADQRFHGALRALAAALEEFSVPWMVIGGVAVIAAGVPRETIDVDVLLGGVVDIASERHDIRAREAGRLYESHGVSIKVSFAALPFEDEALARARRVDLGGVCVPVAQPEDVIVAKAVAWCDRSDVERLLIMHLDAIDLVRVRSLVGEIARVLEEPQRVERFDALVAVAYKAAGRVAC